MKQANGLAYDMVRNPKLAARVFEHRKAEGYADTVTNMAAQSYALLRRSVNNTRNPEQAGNDIKAPQRIMLNSGGIRVTEGWTAIPRRPTPDKHGERRRA